MRLAQVVGNVVATVKARGLESHKLLLVRHVNPAAEVIDGEGEPYAAVDLTGAGDGDVVLVAQGGAARIHHGTGTVPTDAAIVAIVDSVLVNSRVTFEKR
ncbi:MAG: ethanolamine utilization protein EutN [Alphaproteobacteria bacterium]|nr:ethanolamine utilization protein EutN [Alphaproteobacteria bacterium]